MVHAGEPATHRIHGPRARAAPPPPRVRTRLRRERPYARCTQWPSRVARASTGQGGRRRWIRGKGRWRTCGGPGWGRGQRRGEGSPVATITWPQTRRADPYHSRGGARRRRGGGRRGPRGCRRTSVGRRRGLGGGKEWINGEEIFRVGILRESAGFGVVVVVYLATSSWGGATTGRRGGQTGRGGSGFLGGGGWGPSSSWCWGEGHSPCRCCWWWGG